MADDYNDYGIDYDDIETMLDEVWRLRPAKAQFTRLGETAKWFRPNTEAMQGNIFHFKVYTAPASGTRRSAAGTAAEAEFPRARENTYVDIGVPWGDLIMFQGTLNINDIARQRTDNTEHSIYKIADRMISEAETDLGNQTNAAIFQNNDSVMGTINAVYDEDGTAYTSGQTNAYVRIIDGAIGQFVKGQILDIREGADGTDVQVTVVVNDVVHGNDGPAITAGSAPVSDIGPGIVVTIAGENGGDANLDGLAAADEIVLSGEADSSNFHGFPDWFSRSKNVYKATDGSTAIERDTIGNLWSAPEIVTVAASGSEVNFDLDTHLGQLADILPQRVRLGRQQRVKDVDGVNMKQLMLAVTTSKIANEATRDSVNNHRFTTVAQASLDASQRRQVYGDVGFNGVVYHSTTLGDIAIQPDTAAPPFKVRLIEPNSFFFLEQGGRAIRWLDNSGKRFQRSVGSNARLTFYQQAGYYSMCALECDQPAANAEITGVKSSLY